MMNGPGWSTGSDNDGWVVKDVKEYCQDYAYILMFILYRAGGTC
jgi:hypothetical protein